MKYKDVSPIIIQIIGRCHVSATNRQVIRYLISRLKRKYKTWKAMPLADRRQVMKACIVVHAENIRTYNYVMGGYKSRAK